jgi:hypothetical protein
MDILIDPYRLTPALLPCVELVQIETQLTVPLETGMPGPGAAATARADFLNALQSYVSADMNHLPFFPSTPSIKPSTPITIWGGLGTVTTDNNFSLGYVAGTGWQEEFGRFNTTNAGSGNWLEADVPLNITLSSPRNAFCCFITDFGDFDSSLSFQFFLGATLVKSVAIPHQVMDTSEIMHFGYVDGAVTFDRIRINLQVNEETFVFDSVGFDDLVVGLAKPCIPPGA